MWMVVEIDLSGVTGVIRSFGPLETEAAAKAERNRRHFDNYLKSSWNAGRTIKLHVVELLPEWTS